MQRLGGKQITLECDVTQRVTNAFYTYHMNVTVNYKFYQFCFAVALVVSLNGSRAPPHRVTNTIGGLASAETIGRSCYRRRFARRRRAISIRRHLQTKSREGARC